MTPARAGDAPDEGEWLVEGLVRAGPEAAEDFDALSAHGQTKMLSTLRRLRVLEVSGRVVARVGTNWALVDLDAGEGPATLIAFGSRGELAQWLWAGETASLRATMAAAREGVPSREFEIED